MAVTPEDVRPRLNKTSTVDDVELQNMIDAAEAEFEERIGPLSVTSYTEEHAGPTALLKRPVVSVTSVTSYYGTLLVASTDYKVSLAAGVLTLPYYGGPFTVVYTAGYQLLPANYFEVIVADVAGYFSATQRGGGTRPSFPGEDADFEQGTTFPLSPWPRIAALAKRLNPALA